MAEAAAKNAVVKVRAGTGWPTGRVVEVQGGWLELQGVETRYGAEYSTRYDIRLADITSIEWPEARR